MQGVVTFCACSEARLEEQRTSRSFGAEEAWEPGSCVARSASSRERSSNPQAWDRVSQVGVLSPLVARRGDACSRSIRHSPGTTPSVGPTTFRHQPVTQPTAVVTLENIRHDRWLEKAPGLTPKRSMPERPQVDAITTPDRRQTDPTSAPDRGQVDPASRLRRPHIGPTPTRHRPKIAQTSTSDPSQVDPRSAPNDSRSIPIRGRIDRTSTPHRRQIERYLCSGDRGKTCRRES